MLLLVLRSSKSREHMTVVHLAQRFVFQARLWLESYGVHSPRLAANSSYRRKPVSRKPDWIPCQARNDGLGDKTIPRCLRRGRLLAGYNFHGVDKFRRQKVSLFCTFPLPFFAYFRQYVAIFIFTRGSGSFNCSKSFMKSMTP